MCASEATWKHERRRPRAHAFVSDSFVNSSRAVWASPEQSIVVWVFGGLVAVAVSFGDKTVLLLEALGAFRHDGDALPHPLP